MKKILYTTLSFFILLSVASCAKRTQDQVEDTPIIVHDTITIYQDADGNELGTSVVKKERENVKVANIGDIQKLKTFSVIVATLSQQSGVTKLQRSFDNAGIQYAVIKNPANMYYFVVYTSNSEQEAVRARAQFLLDNAADKTRLEIWKQHLIHITDIFILEKE